MKLTYKHFKVLPEAAKRVREEVFMKEQGFADEFDEIDGYASHVVFYDGERPVAVCRYYLTDQELGEYTAGRIAVIKEYRGKHIGEYIMQVLEQLAGSEQGRVISLSAQAGARKFYEKSGYEAVGEYYFDEHCEHILMKKKIK